MTRRLFCIAVCLVLAAGKADELARRIARRRNK